MKIDVHNHAIPTAALEVLARADDYGVTIDGNSWRGGAVKGFTIAPEFYSAEAKLVELEAGRMDGAVVSAAPMLFSYRVDADAGETLARETNRGLADLCAEEPRRLWWMATVPMQAPDHAIAVLEDAAASGCVGVEVATSVNGDYLDNERFEAFWAAAARLGLTIMLHPAYDTPNSSLAPFYLANVIGHQFETTLAAERLICAGTLDRHPSLRLILVHGGGYLPYHLGRLRHASSVRPELEAAPRDPWIYVDRLICDTITHDRAALGYLVARMGAEHVVLGTDLPFDMAERDPITMLQEAVGEDLARTVAEETPARLFDLQIEPGGLLSESQR